MSFTPEEDDNRSPCSLFCLWTHLHGWRHFALAKNKGYWVIWIVVFLVLILMSLLDIAGQMGKFLSGATSTWTRYTLLSEEGTFPAITLCPSVAQMAVDDTQVNVCTDLGISSMWRDKVLNDKAWTYKTTMTDFGLCCNVAVAYNKDDNDTKPHAGMNQGLKVVAYPISGQDGIHVAVHNPYDVPLMGVNSFFMPTGSENKVKLGVAMLHHNYWWCVDNEDEDYIPQKNGKYSLS